MGISASAFEGDQRRSLEAGCNAFVPKPIDVRVVLDQLGHQLGLQWIYAQPESQPAAPAVHQAQGVQPDPNDGGLPPRAQVEALFELAALGDVESIQRQIEEYESLDKHHRPLFTQLRRLADSFQVDKIYEILKGYLE